MQTMADLIAKNVELVRERIARAAGRAGRNAEEITLVAVSKTFQAEAIRRAFSIGVRHFGENRVQEWEAKLPLIADLEARWHLVGHLQSNKARRAARLFHWIDSVDNVSLAMKLDAAAGEKSEWLGVLIEVRLDPASSKAGIEGNRLAELGEALVSLPHLNLRGLMTIPPVSGKPDRARPHFCKLRELRDCLESHLGRKLPELSMGMSHDFEVAIEEGATQIRLGRAIFGPRTAK